MKNQLRVKFCFASLIIFPLVLVLSSNVFAGCSGQKDGANCLTAASQAGVCSGGNCINGCYIGGKIYQSGYKNGVCQFCQTPVSTTSWTNFDSYCPSGQVCYPSSCAPGCNINGNKYYASGAVNPNAPCQICQPSTSISVWTNNKNGASCGGNFTCNNGQCQEGCYINGTYYQIGAPGPNGACQVCWPVNSKSAWTILPAGNSCGSGQICNANGSCVSGCLIGGQNYKSGATKPNAPCQVCQPSSSSLAWSNVNNGTSCGSGNVCINGVCGKK